MGVKYLWDVLEPCKKRYPLDHLQNKRVCVDLSCWMVELHKVNQSYCATKEKVYLRGFFHRLRALIALNCSIILVSDGSIPGIKVPTYRRRLKARFEVADDGGVQPGKQTSLRRNMGSEFSCMIKEAKVIASTLGILCLDGVEEAEAQCALLNSENLCDACFSSDSDIFLFGAKTVYREICLGEGGYVVCYEMEDIQKKLGLGRNSLRTNLQETCHQFFEWPSEKTDEYILPKIAERKLRRYAILQSRSTEVGVNRPLHKPQVPEKCPVSEIIKTRKVQGRECFEVSWNDLEGLEASIVPADLVERACPEKIIEFKEKMEAKKKKKKPKQKQSKSTERETSSPTKASSLIELSLQLQQIDLNSTSTLAISTMEEAEQEKEQQKSKKHDYLRLIDSPAKENSSIGWSTIRRFGVGPSSYSFYPETEVIDLISPCPEARSRNVSRMYQEQKSHEQKCLDHKLENVIELSDSETDDDDDDETEVIDLISPCPEARSRNVSRMYQEQKSHEQKCLDHKLENVIELSDSETDDDDDDGEHCRKARELRMFLENIRKDVIL
ncbi:hypothetical protein F2Q68_00031217 [Brassica cretica]|uniref:Chromo domain-containing protein n=1 Tax=Brassica cretica TaxID=69181 RepID=A0A8S9G972_BRACR|nr:hypothetical protein F2Q68_00031217 [Brassica cretica]